MDGSNHPKCYTNDDFDPCEILKPQDIEIESMQDGDKQRLIPNTDRYDGNTDVNSVNHDKKGDLPCKNEKNTNKIKGHSKHKPVKVTNGSQSLDSEKCKLLSSGDEKEAEVEDALDDEDSAMFARPKVKVTNALDEEDGAMFARTKVKATDALDEEDGAMFARTKVKATDALDEEDGAMFARTKVKATDALDDEDGAMFARTADFLNYIHTSKYSAGFPIAGNLARQDRPTSSLSDFTDFGPHVPSNFDIENTRRDSTDEGENYDDSDSALFNRVNSFKTKDETTTDVHVERKKRKKLRQSELISDMSMRKTKSLSDLLDSNNMPQVSFDNSPEENNQPKSSASLPDYLDTDPNIELSPELRHPNETSNTDPGLDNSTRSNGSHVSALVATVNDDSRSLGDMEGPTECPRRRHFRWKYLFSVIFPTISVFLFLADIGTDINLALRYRREGDSLFFSVTLLCILVPSILMSVVDVSWLCIDNKSMDVPQTEENYCYNTRCWRIFRYTIGVLSFGRIVRTMSHIYHSLRSKMYADNRQLHNSRKIEERRDYCMLDVINAFTESCPQLIAQMFLLYKYSKPFNVDLGISIVFSWLSIGWAYSCYYRYQKQALKEAERGAGQRPGTSLSMAHVFVFCLAVLSALATRICCISLFLVYYPSWIGAIVVSAHFIVMFTWIACYQKPDLEGLTSSKPGRILYYLFFSYLSIMYFVNLKNDRARFRIITYFGIYYLENIAAASLLLYQTAFDYRKSVTEFRWSLIVVPLGLILHILLMLLFYQCLHPQSQRRAGGLRNRNVPA